MLSVKRDITEFSMHPDTSSSTNRTTPSWLTGLWRRRLLAVADGTEDRSTLVYWGQTAALFVDLRLPITIARRKATGSAPQAYLLARQDGFAGRTHVVDNYSVWHRHINFQPESETPDHAMLRREGRLLYEDGMPDQDGRVPYREVWQLIATGKKLCASFELVSSAGPSSGTGVMGNAVLVLIDNWFMLARARPFGLRRGATLLDLTQEAANDEARVAALLDCEISIGRIGSKHGRWRVTHSTIPNRRGAGLFGDDRVEVGPLGDLTARSVNGLAQWACQSSTVTTRNLRSLFS